MSAMLCARLRGACTYLKALEGTELYANAETQQRKALEKAFAQTRGTLGKEARQVVLKDLEESSLPTALKDCLRPLLGEAATATGDGAATSTDYSCRRSLHNNTELRFCPRSKICLGKHLCTFAPCICGYICGRRL